MGGRWRRQPRALLPSLIGVYTACLGAVILLLAVARPGLAAGPPRPEDPIAEIATRLAWRRLLHFRDDVLGRAVSEVDGREFFLAATGKRDPEAELRETLRAFAAPLRPGHEDAHALCRFPARRAWLAAQLPSVPAAPGCPALDAERAAHPLRGVSFVYASNYLGNPASAFGHAFLRLRVLDVRDGTLSGRDGTDLFAEFRAVATTKNPLAYAVMGIAGAFQGKVEVGTYEEVLERYASRQGRDLWEYDLALTDAELAMLALHLWELRSTELDYYYLGRNCAYVVSTILEAAAPRLDLTSGLKVLVFPRDTLVAVAEVPGLVTEMHHRPAIRHDRDPDAGARWKLLTPPSLQHGPTQVTFGSGASSQYRASFATLGFRLALHDLSDPPEGWAPLSEVVILDARARFDLERRALTIDRLTFADVLSLHPLATERRASFRVEAVGERLHDRGCADCFAHGVEGGVGATVATPGRAFAVFVMADASTVFLPHLSGLAGSFVRLGVGPYAGLRLQADRTVAVVTGSVTYLPWSKASSTFDVRLTLKRELARNLALGIEGDAQPLSAEAALVAYRYF